MRLKIPNFVLADLQEFDLVGKAHGALFNKKGSASMRETLVDSANCVPFQSGAIMPKVTCEPPKLGFENNARSSPGQMRRVV